jgi:hypothetical protein
MSDQHEEPHTGPVKTPKQFLLLVSLSFILPIFIIIGLVYYVTAQNKPAAGSTNVAESIAGRIQKVGTIQIKDTNRPMKSGEEVFKGQCAACHAAGALGTRYGILAVTLIYGWAALHYLLASRTLAADLKRAAAGQ